MRLNDNSNSPTWRCDLILIRNYYALSPLSYNCILVNVLEIVRLYKSYVCQGHVMMCCVSELMSHVNKHRNTNNEYRLDTTTKACFSQVGVTKCAMAFVTLRPSLKNFASPIFNMFFESVDPIEKVIPSLKTLILYFLCLDRKWAKCPLQCYKYLVLPIWWRKQHTTFSETCKHWRGAFHPLFVWAQNG